MAKKSADAGALGLDDTPEIDGDQPTGDDFPAAVMNGDQNEQALAGASPAPLPEAFDTWLRLRAESDTAEAVVRDALMAKGAINGRPFQRDGKWYTVNRVGGARRVVEVPPIV